MDRIRDKMKEIESYLNYLVEITPKTEEEYLQDALTRAACERYFEKLVEAVTDAAFLVITEKRWSVPEDDVDAFRILSEKEVIDKELGKRLKDAKGMRNFLAHQYAKVDDKRVYEALAEEISDDVRSFLKAIKTFLS